MEGGLVGVGGERVGIGVPGEATKELEVLGTFVADTATLAGA